jgi:hypothetical protein
MYNPVGCQVIYIECEGRRDRCGSNADDGGAICYNLQPSYLSSCTIFAGQLACLTPTAVDTSIIGSLGWYLLNATKHVLLRL